MSAREIRLVSFNCGLGIFDPCGLSREAILRSAFREWHIGW